jgi:hypothetical protein
VDASPLGVCLVDEINSSTRLLIHVRVSLGLLRVSVWDGGFGTEKLMRVWLAMAVFPGMRAVSLSVVLGEANDR